MILLTADCDFRDVRGRMTGAFRRARAARLWCVFGSERLAYRFAMSLVLEKPPLHEDHWILQRQVTGLTAFATRIRGKCPPLGRCHGRRLPHGSTLPAAVLQKVSLQ